MMKRLVRLLAMVATLAKPAAVGHNLIAVVRGTFDR
jgi:hypothetical protein